MYVNPTRQTVPSVDTSQTCISPCSVFHHAFEKGSFRAVKYKVILIANFITLDITTYFGDKRLVMESIAAVLQLATVCYNCYGDSSNIPLLISRFQIPFYILRYFPVGAAGYVMSALFVQFIWKSVKLMYDGESS